MAGKVVGVGGGNFKIQTSIEPVLHFNVVDTYKSFLIIYCRNCF